MKLVSRVVQRVKSTGPYSLARKIRAILEEEQRAAKDPSRNVISFSPEGECRGQALVSYYIEPYLLDQSKPIPPEHPYFWHASYWECTEMVRSLVELGYGVDVISWRNNTFVPQKEYSIFIDVRQNMQRLAPLLPQDCLKIFH